MTDDIKLINANDNLAPFHPNADAETLIVISGQQKDLPEEGTKKTRFQKIESTHTRSDHCRVQRLLNLLKKSQKLELSVDEKKLATFLVAINDKRETYGGAVLLRKQIRNRHKNRGSSYAFQGEKIWMCFLTLNLPSKDPVYMSGKRRSFCRVFYEDLYEALSAFGKELETPFIWITLDPEEAVCLETFGDFPFILTLKPKDTTDGLFHGLLATDENLASACVPSTNGSHSPRYKGKQK